MFGNRFCHIVTAYRDKIKITGTCNSVFSWNLSLSNKGYEGSEKSRGDHK